jgi:hypothetical protein
VAFGRYFFNLKKAFHGSVLPIFDPVRKVFITFWCYVVPYSVFIHDFAWIWHIFYSCSHDFMWLWTQCHNKSIEQGQLDSDIIKMDEIGAPSFHLRTYILSFVNRLLGTSSATLQNFRS